ncbi:hypothetical protein VIGAN_01186600 [Vigna angularis var. angularis]|uniref:Retrotransposon Copia-like N-terminal domain-containing protein n=1 Tax=Vigna angularis var. angularis TaxID=157739 RepID=A0A0S3R108_PHAAN|nr:hypothetical protein VIGAN_01186600 [Vigna angularis var. angularis]
MVFSFFLVLALVMAEESFIHNYLYLHPGENPTAALVSPVLDGTNYHSWSRSMLTTLSAKNKIEFVLRNVRPRDKDKSEHIA